MMSLSPDEDPAFSDIILERAEEIATRTPERQVYMDYAREVRRTKGDNTKLKELLQAANGADDKAKLIASGNRKFAKMVERKNKEIRAQAVERGEITEAIRAFEALVISSAVPKEVRARMSQGFLEKLTPQGQARELERRTHALDLIMKEHFLDQNQMSLRTFLNEYNPIDRLGSKPPMRGVSEKVANDLGFALLLLRNPDAVPWHELIIDTEGGQTKEEGREAKAAHEHYMREIFGGVLSHYARCGETRKLQRSDPVRVEFALSEAQSIAETGRTSRGKFGDNRRARNAERNDKVVNVMLKGRERRGIDLLIILRHHPFYGLIHLVVIGFLAWAFADNEYGYYIMLRFIVATFFVVMAFRFKKHSEGRIPPKLATGITIFLFIVSSIYTPFFPLQLGREIWEVVNVITILLIGSMLWRYDLFTHHSQR